MEHERPDRGKGRRTAFWAVALGLAILPAVCFALRERLLVEWLRDKVREPDLGVALHAVERLSRLRSAAAAVGLLEGLEHRALNVRIAAAEGLGRMGPAARRAALDRMGERALPAVPGLLEAVMDARSLDARIAAAEMLARFACDDEAVRLALIGSAENDGEDPGARLAALTALDCSGMDLGTIAPTLAALAEEPDALGAMAAQILREEGIGGGREARPRG